MDQVTAQDPLQACAVLCQLPLRERASGSSCLSNGFGLPGSALESRLPPHVPFRCILQSPPGEGCTSATATCKSAAETSGRPAPRRCSNPCLHLAARHLPRPGRRLAEPWDGSGGVTPKECGPGAWVQAAVRPRSLTDGQRVLLGTAQGSPLRGNFESLSPPG